MQYTTSASGTTGWVTIPNSKWAFNGPATVLASSANPLSGKTAFSGFSNGWAFSKANLSFLDGKQIYLRFLYGADEFGPTYDGWFLDDVRVYKCVSDSAKPTVGKPKLDLATGTLGSDATPVLLKVSFTAKDANGIVSTTLRRKVGTGAYVSVDLPSIKATSVITHAPVSTSTQVYRAGARDGADKLGTNSTSAHILGIQESGGAPAVVYTGAWSTESNSAFFGGAVNDASASGRKATLTVPKATDLAWVSTKGPDRGKADVYIDGTKVKTVDLYSATLKTRQVVYSRGFSSAGTHKIEIRVLGTKNASSTSTRVDVDAFLAITS